MAKRALHNDGRARRFERVPVSRPGWKPMGATCCEHTSGAIVFLRGDKWFWTAVPGQWVELAERTRDAAMDVVERILRHISPAATAAQVVDHMQSDPFCLKCPPAMLPEDRTVAGEEMVGHLTELGKRYSDKRNGGGDGQ